MFASRDLIFNLLSNALEEFLFIRVGFDQFLSLSAVGENNIRKELESNACP